MSTSSQTLPSTMPPEIASWPAGLPGSEILAPGLPSPAELARLANAIFNALPEEAQSPAATAAAAVLPSNSAQAGNPYAVVPRLPVPARREFWSMPSGICSPSALSLCLIATSRPIFVRRVLRRSCLPGLLFPGAVSIPPLLRRLDFCRIRVRFSLNRKRNRLLRMLQKLLCRATMAMRRFPHRCFSIFLSRNLLLRQFPVL